MSEQPFTHAIRHVVLVGLSGSGKSTVGPLLAERLQRPFVDTDALIETEAGESIPSIFRRLGEKRFREIEGQVVARVVEGPAAVIATGGGAPVALANRERLWSGNLVVWLDATVEALVERVGLDSGRPLLDGSAEGPAARLRALLAARGPIYGAAHLRVATDDAAPPAVVEQIVAALMAQREERM